MKASEGDGDGEPQDMMTTVCIEFIEEAEGHADEQQQHERHREARRVQRYTAHRQHANVT